MNRIVWLQAAALLLWGFAAGQPAIGALLGLLRLLPLTASVRLKLGEPALNRVVDLTALGVVALFVSLLALRGLPAGLLLAVGWLPVLLLLLLLLQSLNQQPLRLRQLAYSLRTSTAAGTDRVLQTDVPYLALTLVAAAVLAQPSAWFYWALSALVVAWLYPVGASRRRWPGLLAFAVVAASAVASGYGLSATLRTTQQALQDWAVDWLTQVDDDPFRSQTRIGDLGRIKLSGGIVWRVDQQPPLRQPLLLRNGVFTRYVGGEWLARERSFTPLPNAAAAAPVWLTLRGQSHKGLALLALPIDAGPLHLDAGLLERNGYGVLRVRQAPALLRLTLAQASAPVLRPPDPGDLLVPPGIRDAVQRLPAVAALARLSEKQRLAGLQSWFAGNFRYTLFLGDAQHGPRTLEQFLLTDRAGHCEYFASASVLLLRALGIPARYVTGYSVQEYSTLEKTYLARQRHAHAWAEAFVEGRWVEVDHTPSSWLTVEEDAAPFWQPLADLAAALQQWLAEWQPGAAGTDGALASVAAALALALLSGLAYRRWYRRRTTAPASGAASALPWAAEVEAFKALEQSWAELGLARLACEPPRTWLARVQREGTSVLGAEQLAAAAAVIEALYLSRYGTDAIR